MILWTLLMLVPAQPGTVDAKGFSRSLQSSAVAATVRFDHGGSGAIIKQQGPFLYVLTANHAVATTPRVNVQVFTPDSYPRPTKTYRQAEVVARVKEEDLALIRIVTSDEVPGVLPVCAPDQVPSKNAFAALSVGCSDGAAPSCELQEVVHKKLVRRPGIRKAVWFWETAKDQEGGRSGGPLVDAKGRLIGVCNGRNDGKGYYCHIDAIHVFLREKGFRALIEETK